MFVICFVFRNNIRCEENFFRIIYLPSFIPSILWLLNPYDFWTLCSLLVKPKVTVWNSKHGVDVKENYQINDTIPRRSSIPTLRFHNGIKLQMFWNRLIWWKFEKNSAGRKRPTFFRMNFQSILYKFSRRYLIAFHRNYNYNQFTNIYRIKPEKYLAKMIQFLNVEKPLSQKTHLMTWKYFFYVLYFWPRHWKKIPLNTYICNKNILKIRNQTQYSMSSLATLNNLIPLLSTLGLGSLAD